MPEVAEAAVVCGVDVGLKLPSGSKTGVVLPITTPDSSLKSAADALSFIAEVILPQDEGNGDSPELDPDVVAEDVPSERIIGRIFAWVCTTLYLTSRLPQICINLNC